KLRSRASGAPKAQGLIAVLRPQHNSPCRRSRPPVSLADHFGIRGSSPFVRCGFNAAELHIRSPFTERLAPQSLILEVIGLGRAGPYCMTAYYSHCVRRSPCPDPEGLTRPRETSDNDLDFLGG